MVNEWHADVVTLFDDDVELTFEIEDPDDLPIRQYSGDGPVKDSQIYISKHLIEGHEDTFNRLVGNSGSRVLATRHSEHRRQDDFGTVREAEEQLIGFISDADEFNHQYFRVIT